MHPRLHLVSKQRCTMDLISLGWLVTARPLFPEPRPLRSRPRRGAPKMALKPGVRGADGVPVVGAGPECAVGPVGGPSPARGDPVPHI